MDVSSIAGAASAAAAAKTGDAVQVSVLKKAMEVQAQGALALVNALPQPSSLPPNLGQNVNTTA